MKLRDFVLSMASGATPRREEEDRYYADADGGVPFIRVQNLSSDGELRLDDVKYVNRETHSTLLSRSQVGPNDLLVKITGVGRMAVASVPPADFEGNINQHIVRIRTRDRRTSEALAAWLNTDVAETLAKRRSTGGTRPALDFPALRSLPVIIDERVEKALKDAKQQHRQAESEAAKCLLGVGDYVLSELGIAVPARSGSAIADRTFIPRRRELTGGRFDPEALHPEREACVHELQLKKCRPLRRAARFVRDLRTEIPDGALYIGLENVEAGTGRYIPSSEKESVSSAFAFRSGQVLFPKLRPYLNKVFLAPFDGLCSTEFHVLEGVSVRSDFLALFLRSQIVVMQTKHLMSGNTLPRLQTEDVERLLIPDVDPAIQCRLVIEAERQARVSEQLRERARIDLELTKVRIEAMLLGNDKA